MADSSSLSNLNTAPAKSPLRYVVPVMLFVLIVGGIAWLAQNMPSWRAASSAPIAPAKTVDAPIKFLHQFNEQYVLALWEIPSKNPKLNAEQQMVLYEREFERGDEGRYLFPLQNMTENEAELGLVEKKCDCSKLHVALIAKEEWDDLTKVITKDPGKEIPENPAWSWQALEKPGEHGITLPPGAHAVLRATWSNRRPVGERLNLGATVWTRPAGSPKQHRVVLSIPAISSLTVRSDVDRASVGILGPGARGKAEFFVWSPTRADIDVKFQDPNKDPLVTVTAHPMNQEERLALQAKLREKETNTRVLAGYKVNVTVDEHKGDRWFGQGHFLRAVSVVIPDAVDEISPLVVTGVVKGPVDVGEERGKIDLKQFPARDGTRKVIFLWTDRATQLVVESKQPAALEVKLAESKEKAGAKRKWVLEVIVPPNQLFGPIAEESAVILRTQTPANPSAARQVRIPLVGHAVQG